MPSLNLDTVDGAFEEFKKLLPELGRWASSVVSEEDTKLKIINPIFNQVLGWDLSSFVTEEPAGDGFLDYKFSIDGRSRLIVEAKRDSSSLGLSDRTPGKPYKLSGPVLSQAPQPRGGVLQAIRYCGAKNTELACVTNGHEWVVFRGSRLGDGNDTSSGMAFIFPSLESVSDNFKLFYDLLSRSQVEKYAYRAYFQEAEGQPIRAKAFSKTLRPVDGYRLLDRPILAKDIDRVMSAFFRKISGDDDPEMLAECFVTTRESQAADESIIRIADDLATRVTTLDSDQGTALTEVIKGVKETHRNEFILIVGTKGAGKSTFIDRFFRNVLPSNLKNECIVTRIDLSVTANNEEKVITWLNRQLTDVLEKAIFKNACPTYDELQGMYFDEYQRWMRGPYKFLYENNKIDFKTKFGAHVESRREDHPEDYIERMLRHIVLSRRKIPCLIFDNTDHFSIEFQEIVFQYARSIYEKEICLVIIPITDKTSWQLSQQGALQSFDNQAFFLPTPLPKIVIEQRIRYIENRLLNEKKQKGSGYFTSKGIHLSFEDLQGFVACLQHVFLETGNVATWIGNLANKDIRRCLLLSRDVVSSPYLKIDDLLKAFMSHHSYSLSDLDVKRAVIRKGYNYYPTGQNAFVQNIFSLNTEVDSTPLLGLRVLRLLRDAKHHDAGGLEDYVQVDQILDYFQAMGIERRATLLCLNTLLKTGLCYSYDPTHSKIEDAKKIQLSPGGFQHLHWGSWDEVYIGSMLQVTPIADETAFQQLKSLASQPPYLRWRNEVIIFLEHVLSEDSVFIIDISHPAYDGQAKLTKSLKKKIEILQADSEQPKLAKLKHIED